MIDSLLIFSEKQKITGTVVSDNFIDFDTVFNVAKPLPQVVATVDETFDTLTSLEIKVCASVDGADSSADEIASSGKIPLAKLKAGELIPINIPVPFRNPKSGKNCLFVKYVVEGSNPSNGSITTAVEEYPFTNIPSDSLA